MDGISGRDLRPGVYAASMTFFRPDTDELDLETQKRHIIRLANSGLAGIISLGSNGEAPHLNTEERRAVVKATVEALSESGYSHLPVVVGASAPSVKETIALCQQAKEAGGSHVLVLPPCYFRAAMTPDAIYDFFMEVAEGSPLPVVLYSFPAVTAGIEMDSDLLIRISKAHPNIIGTKFTCGDTGKLARVARSMDTKTPSQPGKSYWAVAGLADFALQGLVAGASGVVAGGANVLPKTCVRVYELFRQGRFDEAMKAQSLLSEGDWPHTGAGIGATKAVLQQVYGYGGHGRSPLRRLSSKTAESIVAHMKDVLAFESTL